MDGPRRTGSRRSARLAALQRQRAAVFDLPTPLLLRVLEHLPPNVVACTGRLVCKEAAQCFRGPQHRTVRLSQPLPPHAAGLLRCWQEALPQQPFLSKLLALSAAAASGCETNLEVALRLVQSCTIPSLWPHHYMQFYEEDRSKIPLDPGTVAASHGHGHLLPWLHARRCPLHPRETLEAAARHCDLAALQWAWRHYWQDRGSEAQPQCSPAGDTPVSSLARSPTCSPTCSPAASPAAASSASPSPSPSPTPEGATSDDAPLSGDDEDPRTDDDEDPRTDDDEDSLSGDTHAGSDDEDDECVRQVAYCAGCSRSASALAKLKWLLAVLPPAYHVFMAEGAAVLGSVPRLQWLQARGVPLEAAALAGALRSPHAGAEVVEWLEEQGAGSAVDLWQPGGSAAPVSPHKLGWLASRPGVVVTQAQWDAACRTAAIRGDLQLVARLHETHGAALSADVWDAAAASGDIPLLSWLHERGCPARPGTCLALMCDGRASLIEWMLREARCTPPTYLGNFCPTPAAYPAIIVDCKRERPDLLRAMRLLVDAGLKFANACTTNDAARHADLPVVQLVAGQLQQRSRWAGCTDCETMDAAVWGGCEAVLRGVVELGCARLAASSAYGNAGCNGDAATLSALLRMGMPCGEEELEAVHEGCPPGVAEALAALKAELGV